MSDHDTWNMFAAASYAAWMAGGDYAAEECRTRAVADADWFVIESKKREKPAAPTVKRVIDDGFGYPIGHIVDGPNGPEIVSEAGVTK